MALRDLKPVAAARTWAEARGLPSLGLVVALILAGLVVGAAAGFVIALVHAPEAAKPLRTVGASSEVRPKQAGALAVRFRPWLQFDSGEHWRPLDIDSLFAERDANGNPAELFCTRDLAGETVKPCRPVGSVGELESDAARADALGESSFINIPGDGVADYYGHDRCRGVARCDNPPDSAIYYHVTRANDRFYVDYWWFFRFNDFDRHGLRATCRERAAIEAQVCDEHEGDWEGVTVATAPSDALATDDQQLGYVAYAAHKGVLRYAQSELGLHDGTRPDVFVARGSHASYPKPCSPHPFGCTQPTALAFKGLVNLPEGQRDGKEEWDRNGDQCQPGAGGSCLQPLPSPQVDPSAWTIWKGQWGDGCGGICGQKPTLTSPSSPGVQDRYKTPGCSTQGTAFGCDGVVVRCSDWLGPLVAAVACDPDALAKKTPSTPPLRVSIDGRHVATETTPGVAQVVHDPIAAGHKVAVSGAHAGDQVLVRARRERHLVEARFIVHRAQLGRDVVVHIVPHSRGLRLRLARRGPVSRTVIKIRPPGA